MILDAYVDVDVLCFCIVNHGHGNTTMVLDASLLYTQHYKVQIKGK